MDNHILIFSPNDDNVNDTVVPSLYFLRNAKEVNIEVLDSNGNKIRDLYHSYNIVKRLSKIDKESIFINGALWDGTTYDQKTGKNVKVSDGKYVIRVRSKLDLENAKEQVLDMSVKVDTKAPEANIESLEKYSDEKGNLHYKISWKAMDEENGSGIKPEFIISVNGNNNIDYFDKEPKEGVYSADVSFEDQGINNINIIVSDYAGNSCMLSKTDKTKDSDSPFNVIIRRPSAIEYLNKDSIEDGTYIVSGFVNNNNGKVKINDIDVNIEGDLTFEHKVKLKEGRNNIKLYAEDNDGNVIKNYSYIISPP